eukprot:519312-Rhodomonas_salina.1
MPIPHSPVSTNHLALSTSHTLQNFSTTSTLTPPAYQASLTTWDSYYLLTSDPQKKKNVLALTVAHVRRVSVGGRRAVAAPDSAAAGRGHGHWQLCRARQGQLETALARGAADRGQERGPGHR